jgi:hypothetical protein
MLIETTFYQYFVIYRSKSIENRKNPILSQ